MRRVALQALGLVVVVPALLVIYLFREAMGGKEIPLLLLLALSVLGFYLVWRILRSFSVLQRDLERLARGEAGAVSVPDGASHLQEMAEIINSLNRLTIDFRENAAQLERFIQQFAVLTELTEITAKVPEIDDLLHLVLEKAMGAVRSRCGCVLLRREGEAELDIVASEGWRAGTPECAESLAQVARRVLESGRPLLVECEPGAGGPILVLPLQTKAGTVGAVCLVGKDAGGSFSAEDQRFLTVMLGQIGYAVENARLLQHAREAAQNLKRRVEDQEEQIQDAQRQIVKAEKLSALGQLAGGVAHDFNNLLQAILGYTAFAQEGLEEDDKRHRDLEHVRRAAEQAATMTRELLAFGRRQVLQTSNLELNLVIEEQVKMLNGVIGPRTVIEFSPAEQRLMVRADQRQVEQILVNLCLNARDAMPEGGRIRVATGRAVMDEEYCRGRIWASPGDYAVITVEDAGVGMSRETLGQIFEPFFTTKEAGQGTGLGLSTVYGTVQQHGGLIDVRSEPGLGSSFAIYLPRVDRPASPAAAGRAERAPAGGTETILVVDDDEVCRVLCARVLEGAGYTVLAAREGEEALRLFHEHPREVAMALTDLVLPRIPGNEVARRLRALQPGIGVLVISGHSPAVLNFGALEEEGLRFLEKPIRAATLLRVVREILDAPGGRHARAA